MSVPSYIPALLQLHRPQGIHLASSPSINIPPKFGSSAPQMSPEDFSQPASPAQKLEQQEVIASLVYYARILYRTLLPAVTHLAYFQAAPPILDTMAALEHGTPSRLLREVPQCNPGYPPLPYATYRVLRCLLLLPTDPNRSNSGSTIGGLHTLSDHSPDKLNAAVHAESSGIPVVVNSADDAELSSAFGNAKIAHDARTILNEESTTPHLL